MLLLVDPRQHAIADITRVFRSVTVETYDGTTGDIFAQVNDSVGNDIEDCARSPHPAPATLPTVN